MKHSDLKAKVLSNPEVKAAYDEMAPEFSLLRQMLKARQGKRQALAKQKLLSVWVPNLRRLHGWNLLWAMASILLHWLLSKSMPTRSGMNFNLIWYAREKSS